jgi:hypothetical protein
MDKIGLNQARSFLYHRLVVHQNISGIETFESFSQYYIENDLKNNPDRTITSLILILRDGAKTFQLLNQMTAAERKIFPCLYECAYYGENEISTKFIFSHIALKQLDKFLDHLSCFIALYLKEVLAMEPWDMILLSQSSNPSQIFNKL